MLTEQGSGRRAFDSHILEATERRFCGLLQALSTFFRPVLPHRRGCSPHFIMTEISSRSLDICIKTDMGSTLTNGRQEMEDTFSFPHFRGLSRDAVSSTIPTITASHHPTLSFTLAVLLFYHPHKASALSLVSGSGL